MRGDKQSTLLEREKVMREELEKMRELFLKNSSESRENLERRFDKIREVLEKSNDNFSKNFLHSQRNMNESQKNINERLDNASKVIGSVRSELGKISSLPTQVQELLNVFQAAKLRGNVGEKILENMISQILPHGTYQFQHRFSSGEIVDVLLSLKQGKIAIDSKFPLENFRKASQSEDEKEKKSFRKLFRRDVKKHISDIKKKYIRPDQKTFDFAVMYVPSESVFYDIQVIDEEIADFANENRVFAMSPNTLFYFLKVVMLGFEGQRIEQNAKIILDEIKGIRNTSIEFGKKVNVLGNHINHAKSKMDEVTHDFSTLNEKISRTAKLKSVEQAKRLQGSANLQ